MLADGSLQLLLGGSGEQMGGVYRCTVYNRAGSDSVNITVFVNQTGEGVRLCCVCGEGCAMCVVRG